MAQRQFRTNGAAAYDIHARRGAAAPRTDGESLPEERPQPVRKTRVKAKVNVSPFAIGGVALTVFLFVLVIFGYVQLYEASSELGRLQQQLASIETANETLNSQYEGRIDLAVIEDRAIHELGMSQPMSSQNVYLNLNDQDRAVITREEKQNFFSSLVDACTNGVRTMADYIGKKKNAD